MTLFSTSTTPAGTTKGPGFLRSAMLALATCILLAAQPVAAATKPTGHEFTWEAWFTVALIVVLLVALILDAVPATSAMIMSAMLLHLVGIVSVTELFAGMVNNGVLSIVFLFVIVTPMTQLPLMKKMVEVTLAASKKTEEEPEEQPEGGLVAQAKAKQDGETAVVPAGGDANAKADSEDGEKEPETVFWPTTKLVLLSILTSSFVENTPHVAAFTPMVTKFCMEHGVAPSLLLLPMNFAVILGNYGVVGCSSNLVFSGLMEADGYGQMNFFELLYIGGPQLPIIALYLIVMPWFLLPRDKGGMVGGAGKKDRNMTLRLLVPSRSNLVGMSAASAKRRLAGGEKIVIEQVVRGDETIDTEKDALAPNDVMYMSATPILLMAACEFYGLDFVTANNNLARAQATKWTAQRHASRHGTPAPEEQEMGLIDTAKKVAGAVEDAVIGTGEAEQKPNEPVEPTPAPAAETSKPSDDEGARNAVGHAKKVKLVLAEMVLSARNYAVGSAVRTQRFQSHYGASILGLRSSLSGEDLNGDALRDHVLVAGDTLLCLVASTFEKDHGTSYEFLMISMLSKVAEAAEDYVLSFPAWAPFGIPQGETPEGKPQRKVVVMPPEYGYLSLLIFTAVVVAAVFHITLSVLCLGGAILIVLLGLSTTQKALKMIHLDVYALIAFSFPLGSAVKNSGLAAWIGLQIQYAGIEGFALMLILTVLAVVLTNAITNKAACQVMYPIIVAIYRAQNKDPLPAVYAAAYAVVLALCTPYAIPPNVLVFGPGGYSGMDYMKFGLPITILCTLLTAVFANLVYGVQW